MFNIFGYNLTNPDSLRQKVFTKKRENNNLTLRDFYKFFKKSNKNSVRTYFNQANKDYPPDISKNISRGNAKISPSKPSSINEKLIEMDDTLLMKSICTLILCDDDATHRERLDAVSKLMVLKEKLGTLNQQTQTEKEVIERFKQKPTQTLVGLLRESSQKELS